MLPGVLGILQATEIIKMIVSKGELLKGKLLMYDALYMNFRKINIQKNNECDLCGVKPKIKKLIKFESFFKNDEQKFEKNLIHPKDLKKILDSNNKVFLFDLRESYEWEICKIKGAILSPLNDFKIENYNLKINSQIILYCHKGKRSLTALKNTIESGFYNVKSLQGGIDFWASEMDKKMPRY